MAFEHRACSCSYPVKQSNDIICIYVCVISKDDTDRFFDEIRRQADLCWNVEINL